MRITLTLPDALVTQLRDTSARSGVQVSTLVHHLVQDSLTRGITVRIGGREPRTAAPPRVSAATPHPTVEDGVCIECGSEVTEANTDEQGRHANCVARRV